MKDKNLKSMVKEEFGNNFRQIIILGALIVIWVGFGLLTKGTFIKPRNISFLFLQASAAGIVSIGVVFILVSGNIDLSIGSLVGFMGTIAAALMVFGQFETIPTILIVLACGLVAGAWQGYWVAYRRVPSFIVTLAGMQIFRGGVLLITNGQTISPMNDSFKAIGQNYFPGILAVEKGFIDTPYYAGLLLCLIYIIREIQKYKTKKQYEFEVPEKWFVALKILVVCGLIVFASSIFSQYLGIPYVLVLLGLIAAIMEYISSNTVFGRHIYAIGGNREAARLSGINIKKTIFMMFVLMGLMCSISGIIFTARINAGTAGAGSGMEMDAIAGAIIGGTSTMGGEGSIIGAILGALIMTSIDNGMSIMNMPAASQYIVKGIVLLLAVWLDVSTRKKGADA